MLRMRVYIAGAALLMASAAGASAQGPKQEQGEMLGGFLGNLLSAIPGGSSTGGQILRSLAPAIGTLVGGSVGAQLDAEDRASLQAATLRALNSGKRQTFKGPKGARGSVTVVSRNKGSSGEPCVTVKQDVVLKTGQAETGNVSACKGAKGWSV